MLPLKGHILWEAQTLLSGSVGENFSHEVAGGLYQHLSRGSGRAPFSGGL